MKTDQKLVERTMDSQVKHRVSQVQKDLRKLVEHHSKVSLARWRKELKLAYAYIHKTQNDDESVKELSPYRAFVKEQTALLKNDARFEDQRERMQEISVRWKAHKMSLQN